LFRRAGDEIRTRDPDLGKVVLYQLSYSRLQEKLFTFPYCGYKSMSLFLKGKQNCK
jgi:hypothetical protein